MRFERAFLLIAMVIALPAMSALNRWSIDGPLGGKVNQFATDPAIPSTVYAGTSNGMFRSEDAGQHWSAIPEMFGTTVSSIAVTAADAARVLAATNSGLWRSNDHGATWKLVSSQFLVAYRVGVSPSNADVVYIDSNQGLRSSTDGGVTFGAAVIAPPGGPITALRVDPLVTTTVYASFNSNFGVYKSVDSGAHWSAANGGLPTSLFFTVYALEIDPTNGSVLYAAGQGGVYKSSDGGGSWSALDLPISNGYAYSLSINRSSPSTLLAATSAGLFKTSDGGAHWAAAAHTFEGGVFAVAITSLDATSIVAADYTVYRSSDGGATVKESSNGFTAFSAQALATDPSDASTVYAGGPQGTFRSSDHGRTWTRIDRVSTSLAVDATDSKTIYTLFFGALYRSTDGGLTWAGYSNGLPGGTATEIAPAPGIHGRLYAIADGAVYRRDGEESWTLLNNGLTGSVTSIAFDPANGQSVFAASSSGLFTSANGGNTWSSVSLPSGFTPSRVAVDPFDAHHWFAWSDTSNYATSDAGTTWAAAEWAFQNAIAFDPANRGRVYLYSAAVLRVSFDGGKTWMKGDYGLGPVSGALLVVAKDGTVFKAGPDGGVFVFQPGRRQATRRQ